MILLFSDIKPRDTVARERGLSLNKITALNTLLLIISIETIRNISKNDIRMLYLYWVYQTLDAFVIGYYLFKWIGFTIIANSMILIVTLVGATILIINAQKFDHNKTKKTKLTYFILGFVFFVHVFALFYAIGLITYGFIPSKTIYGHDTIRFTGMYEFEVSIDEIANVELSDTLSTIKIRTNGFSFGTVKKEFFNLDNFAKSRLLIHSDIAPYLLISKTNGDKIIMNFKDENEAEKLHNNIKALIDK